MIAKLFHHRKDNIFQIAKYVLEISDIKFTETTLDKRLKDHIDYPSLLALKDVLFSYGIESAAIRKDAYSYDDFETPFICYIQQEDWSQPAFTVVTMANEHFLEFLHPSSNKKTRISISAFEKMDKEIILLLDTEGGRAEENYVANRRQERYHSVLRQLPVYLFTLIWAFAFTFQRNTPTEELWLSMSFLLNSGIGLLLSTLLITHDINAHNPFVREVCGAFGKKSNCNAVLSSKGANFLGISWSIWGFAYFANFFLSQLFFASHPSYAYLWAILSILVSPYILYSLYYQWRVVRQWCPLCMGVQAILFINAIASISYLLEHKQPESVGIHDLFILAVMGTGILLLTFHLVPIVKEARDGRNYEHKWKKLRYHPDVFQSLLQKSNPVTVSPEGLGIVIGNPKAQNEIIKVCNPYCGPCSKAHPELEHIVRNNPDVKLRIIFTASGEDSDIRTAPVSHLLAVQEKYGHDKAQQALDDWYLASQKDYEAFATKYPMNGELKQQQDKIYAMRDWCNSMKIRATPTIFINGYELPESYRVVELKNFF